VAFEEFVAAVANRLLLSAVLLVSGDRAAAEDLLQGAFERTYRPWPRIGRGRRRDALTVFVGGSPDLACSR